MTDIGRDFNYWAWRARLGWTPRQAGAALDYSEAGYLRIENGSKPRHPFACSLMAVGIEAVFKMDAGDHDKLMAASVLHAKWLATLDRALARARRVNTPKRGRPRKNVP